MLSKRGVNVLRGIHTVHIDSKNRLAIPNRYRELLTTRSNNNLVITVDIEAPCLLIYPEADWLEIEQQLMSLPAFQAGVRDIQRLLVGHALDVTLDRHGRVLISSMLKDYAQLSKAAILVGQGKKLELWDSSTWFAHCKRWREADHNLSLLEVHDPQIKNIIL